MHTFTCSMRFSRCPAADPDMVDYLMATLQSTKLPPLPPMQHRPLVVKDLLALRHSQLHCLQAARHRAAEVRSFYNITLRWHLKSATYMRGFAELRCYVKSRECRGGGDCVGGAVVCLVVCCFCL